MLSLGPATRDARDSGDEVAVADLSGDGDDEWILRIQGCDQELHRIVPIPAGGSTP